MRRFVQVVLVVVSTASGVAADETRPIREARSANNRYALRVTPGRPGRLGRVCTAALYDLSGGGTGRQLWERPLVNDVAPAQAFVREDGRFVVTLDEWRRGGARNALVIYGSRGELLRHFLITDLLERADWPSTRIDRHSVVWLTEAKAGFSATGDEFEIVTRWGRTIHLNLNTLRLVGPSPAAADGTPPAVLALLMNGDDSPGSTDTTAAAPPETQPAVTQLPPAAASQPGAELVAAAGQEPSTAPALPPQDVRTPAAERVADAGADEFAATRAGAGSAAYTVSALPTDVVVPSPDPGAPVDYVAWLNAFGQAVGPDAQPLYSAAMGEMAPWTGSNEQLQAALRGDPAALGAADISAWLAANAAALRDFHEAAQYPALSWSHRSGDGTLIGVTLPELAPLRGLAKASVIEGRQLADAGQAPAAAQRFLDALSAGAHISSGMTMIESLVGAAVQTPAAEALLDLQAGPGGAQLDYAALAAQAEAACRPIRPSADVIQAERAMFLDAAQRMWAPDPAGGPPVLDRDKAMEFLKFTQDLNADPTNTDAALAARVEQIGRIGYDATVAYGNAFYDATTHALSRPYPEAAVALGEIENVMVDPQGVNPFLSSLAPAVGRFEFLRTRAETNRRGALLVTAINAYRQQTGEFPESLAALGGVDYATDPFANAPFEYQRTADGFALQSPGGTAAPEGYREKDAKPLRIWPRGR